MHKVIKKCSHKLLKDSRTALKTEIGLTVHELCDSRKYVNHITS